MTSSSPVRRRLSQIGGSNALTLWSWVITLPLTLVVGNVATQPGSTFSVLTWTFLLLLVHVVMGVLIWLIKITLLPSKARRSRPRTAIAIFLALGLIRAGLLEMLDPLFGPQGTTLTSRLLTSVLGGAIVLALIAVLVDDYRSHSQVVQQLQRARESLKWLSEREAETLRSADLDEIAAVRSQIENQLRAGATGPEHIRNISESIVRARSHYLSEYQELEVLSQVQEQRTGRELAASMASGLNWPNPLVLALIVELLVFGPVGTTWGWNFAFANAVLGTALISGGTFLLRRWVPLPSNALLRPLVLSLALISLGLAVTMVISTTITSLIGPYPPYLGPSTVLMFAVGLSISVWKAVNVDQSQQRGLLMFAVAEEAQEVGRIHNEVNRRRAAASEFLHGPIQSQLVASALRGESNEKALEAIERRFSEYEQGEPASWNPQEQVTELIEAWSGVMKINVTCSSDTWDRLAREPLTSRLLVDTLSEALTNSVRHGEPNDVNVTIDTQTSGEQVRVQITVVTFGRLTRGIGNGTGLARLIDRGAQITLAQDGQHVVLTALL